MSQANEDKKPVEEHTKTVRLLEAYGENIDDDEHLYKPITGDSKRNLSLMQQTRMQKLAVYLWESNNLADRLIELPLAFILGEGVKLTVPDDEWQKVLDRFWRDPINRMNLAIEEFARELALFGEQCYPTFVNEHSGHVRLGYLDPSLIAKVICDPDNPRIPIGIITVKDTKWKRKKYKIIINADENVFTEKTQKMRETFEDGECFYHRIRGLANGSRGRSDLLPQMDWLDAYDQFMFGELDRNDHLRAFIWDVTLKGASKEEVEERAKTIKVPSSGGIRVHNENEEWNTAQPELDSADSSEAARLFRNHILGGATIPEHWYGGGGDVNRSTAGEMDEPTFKILGMRQRRIKYMLEEIGTYVIRQKALAEKPNEEIDLDHFAYQVVCECPDMVQRDTTKYASALQQIAAACIGMINTQIINKEFAVKLITQAAKRLGVECEAEDLLKEVGEVLDKEEEDDLPKDSDLAKE